jgi:hypothetical protein
MDTLSLSALQAALHRGLLDEGGGNAAIDDHVHGDARLPAARRVQIYRHAYRARLRDVLRDVFEKTRAYVGDAAFDQLGGEFIQARPPRHRNLRWYGAGFDAWLATAIPDAPEVAELASIDWQLRLAFDAADDIATVAPLAVDLAGVDWTRAGCRFTSTLGLSPLHSNAAAIWTALDAASPPPAAGPLAAPAWLLVWRKAWQAQFRTIAADERALLDALRTGMPLAAACAELGATLGPAPAAALAAACLPRWVDDGLVVGLALD